MVGKGVLLECLDDPKITEVLTVGRSLLEEEDEKLHQLPHQNFLDFGTCREHLKGFDAAFLCMGVSAAGLSEEKYRELTYDYTLSLARVLLELNPHMTLTYVSGQGTDSSERGRTMWARVKGKTENDLLKLGFKKAFMYRPGAIIPLRGIKSRTRLYQFIYDYFMWLIKLMKRWTPDSIVNTTQIGQSMIKVAQEGYEKVILDPKDIIDTAGSD